MYKEEDIENLSNIEIVINAHGMQIYIIKVFQWKLTEDNIILLNVTLILYYLLKKSYLISLK